MAKKYGLDVVAYGKHSLPGDIKKGKFTTAIDHMKPPVPDGPSNDTVGAYIVGTTRHPFEDVVFQDLCYPIMMTPFGIRAMHNSKYYAISTRNIYRYPWYPVDMKTNNIHSVDEKMRVDSFFYEYIQNVNTPDADN